ncbi:unnamed protein product, partial [Pylaiella littoralis]
RNWRQREETEGYSSRQPSGGLSAGVSPNEAGVATSGSRPVLDTCTPLDIVSLLGAQPTQDGWRTLASVEQDLGLDDNAVSSSRRSACIGVKGKQLRKDLWGRLGKRGVYRRLGTQRPHRVWWLAFCGEGNPAPDISPPRDFDKRGDDGLAGEDAVDEDLNAASHEEDTYASGGLARARDEEGSVVAAGEEVTDKARRRCGPSKWFDFSL